MIIRPIDIANGVFCHIGMEGVDWCKLLVGSGTGLVRIQGRTIPQVETAGNTLLNNRLLSYNYHGAFHIYSLSPISYVMILAPLSIAIPPNWWIEGSF